MKEGGNLASVDMSYDQAFISGAVQQGKTDAWIGLRRMVDDDDDDDDDNNITILHNRR